MNVVIICSCLPVVFIVFRGKTGFLNNIRRYIGSRWIRKTTSRRNKKLATDTPSEDVAYKAQLPDKPSVAADTSTVRGQDQTQSGSRSIRQYIEMLEYDELETVNHDENDAATWQTPRDLEEQYSQSSVIKSVTGR